MLVGLGEHGLGGFEAEGVLEVACEGFGHVGVADGALGAGDVFLGGGEVLGGGGEGLLAGADLGGLRKGGFEGGVEEAEGGLGFLARGEAGGRKAEGGGAQAADIGDEAFVGVRAVLFEVDEAAIVDEADVFGIDDEVAALDVVAVGIDVVDAVLIDGGGAGEIDGGGGGEDAAVGRWHGRRPCEAVRAFVMLAEAAVEDAFAVVGEADGDVFDAAARAGGGFS